MLTADGLEMAAGHEPITYDASGLSDFNKWRGASLHELLHCFGLPHPPPEYHAEFGEEVWYTPMGACGTTRSITGGRPRSCCCLRLNT
jgi:hypothetical protein